MKRSENGFKIPAYKEHEEVSKSLKKSQRVPAPRYYSLKIRVNEREYNTITKAAETAGMSLAGVARYIIMNHLETPMQKILLNEMSNK